MAKIDKRMLDLTLWSTASYDGLPEDDAVQHAHSYLGNGNAYSKGVKTFTSPPRCQGYGGALTKENLPDAMHGYNTFFEETLTLTEEDAAHGWAWITHKIAPGLETSAELSVEGAGPCVYGVDFEARGNKILFNMRIQAGDKIEARYLYGDDVRVPETTIDRVEGDYSGDVICCAAKELERVVMLTKDNARWSRDGVTWSKSALPVGVERAPSKIVWSPERGIFLTSCVNATQYLTSSDGETWTLRDLPNGAPGDGTELDYVEWIKELGKFVSVCGRNEPPHFRSYTSEDGLSFTIHAPSVSEQRANDAIADGYTTVLGRYPSGAYPYYDAMYTNLYSVSGICWDAAKGRLVMTVSNAYIGDNGAFYNNYGYNVSGCALIVSADGGVTWQTEVCEWMVDDAYNGGSPEAQRGTLNIGEATWCPTTGKFVVFGPYNDVVLTSTDGIVWDVFRRDEECGYGWVWDKGLGMFVSGDSGEYGNVSNGLRFSRDGLEVIRVERPLSPLGIYAAWLDALIFVRCDMETIKTKDENGNTVRTKWTMWYVRVFHGVSRYVGGV